jgi:hypothetical protein
MAKRFDLDSTPFHQRIALDMLSKGLKEIYHEIKK